MGDHMKYGIVIDSGSSGSRLQIYQWEDPLYLSKSSKDELVLNSVPKLIQEENWSHKISPGISSFEDKPELVWKDHFQHLVEYLEEIIPKDKQLETPFFVLATAGMRLVPELKRNLILNNVCSSVNMNSNFHIPDCQNYVQVIDGETEGLFGWIGLNYLMGQYTGESNTSYGFMDMGGASTQIAFVPSSDEEIARHKDDLYTVTLRNLNGENQDWNVFVSTWLGFGANQARKRHLKNVISSLPGDSEDIEIYDPCSPKGASIKFNYNDKDYKLKGLGNYEHCLKDIYPLLLKHLPCKDEPCLFNGIHAPLIDFEKDKFVGVSEYWYTANDVFNMGGEYSFMKFNAKVQEFCNDDWEKIIDNFNNGKYGSNMKLEYLKDSCFKASWVINVLHEGFGLPRIGLDTEELEESKIKALNEEHISFQSANLVKGSELSWTLGKMLLYASSEVPLKNKEKKVGITPSDNIAQLEDKKFVAGNAFEGMHSVIANKNEIHNFYPVSIGTSSTKSSGGVFFFLFMILLFAAIFRQFHLEKFLNTKTINKIFNSPMASRLKLQLKNLYYTRLASQEVMDLRDTNESLRGIEEGLGDENSNYIKKDTQGNILRTRSSILSLQDMHSNSRPTLQPKSNTSSHLDFQNSFHSMKFKKSDDAAPTNKRNTSTLDFNKLRSSITNGASDIKRNVSNSRLDE